MGYQEVYLYTEDTYDLPDYPFFGYMRGKYSPEEIRFLDEKSCSLGLELIPCIQTLGHLERFSSLGKAALHFAIRQTSFLSMKTLAIN